MTARCSPPWPARSPWPSPSMLRRRTMTGPSTGSFQTPVYTVFPCHCTFLGMPTLTETSLPTGSPRLDQRLAAVDLQGHTSQERVCHREQHGSRDVVRGSDSSGRVVGG